MERSRAHISSAGRRRFSCRRKTGSVADFLRTSRDVELDRFDVAEHEVDLPAAQQTPAPEHVRAFPSTEDIAKQSALRGRGLAVAGATSVVVLSLAAGAPLAGLAVVGGAIALISFGNSVVDNTL